MMENKNKWVILAGILILVSLSGLVMAQGTCIDIAANGITKGITDSKCSCWIIRYPPISNEDVQIDYAVTGPLMEYDGATCSVPVGSHIIASGSTNYYCSDKCKITNTKKDSTYQTVCLEDITAPPTTTTTTSTTSTTTSTTIPPIPGTCIDIAANGIMKGITDSKCSCWIIRYPPISNEDVQIDYSLGDPLMEYDGVTCSVPVGSHIIASGSTNYYCSGKCKITNTKKDSTYQTVCLEEITTPTTTTTTAPPGPTTTTAPPGPTTTVPPGPTTTAPPSPTIPPTPVSEIKEQIGSIICMIIQVLMGIAAAIAALMIILSGIKWMTSEDPAGRKAAKDTITHVIIGLIIIVIAGNFINFIVTGVPQLQPFKCELAGITPGVVAIIDAKPTSGTATLTVNFDGSGSRPPEGKTITSYSWNFGDGSLPVSGATTTHPYSNPGVYTATLTVTADGDTGSSSVTITVNPTAGQIAVTITSPTKYEFTEGDNIHFDCIVLPETGTYTYTWVSSRDGTIGSEKSVYKNDLSLGSHTITLTVKDSSPTPLTDSKSISIEILEYNDPPVINQIIVTPTPGGDIYDTGTILDLSPSYTDPDETTPGYPTCKWEVTSKLSGGTYWTSAVCSPTIPTYTLIPGDNEIKLTITDSGGKKDTKTTTINVKPKTKKIEADIATTPDPCSAGIGQSIKFDASGSRNDFSAWTELNYKWDFKDGFTSSDKVTYHSYGVKGDYDVKLTVSINKGGLNIEDSVEEICHVGRPCTVATVGSDCRAHDTDNGNNLIVKGTCYWQICSANVCSDDPTGIDDVCDVNPDYIKEFYPNTADPTRYNLCAWDLYDCYDDFCRGKGYTSGTCSDGRCVCS